MRSPLTKRASDAESELNLPPGFRFHPTDEELIVHYLCRKSRSIAPNPSIIGDVDIYKHEPWELPGNGYWKATGVDKPIKSKTDTNATIGIKKGLVFYAGRGLKGIKTNWIMHEYRLTNSKLDDWVLCRLYNKKNNPKEMIIVPEDNNIRRHRPTSSLQKEKSSSNNSGSFDSFESLEGEFGGSFEGDVLFSGDLPPETLTRLEDTSELNDIGLIKGLMQKESVDGLSLEDLHHCLEAMPPTYDNYEMPMFYNSNQQVFE